MAASVRLMAAPVRLLRRAAPAPASVATPRLSPLAYRQRPLIRASPRSPHPQRAPSPYTTHDLVGQRLLSSSSPANMTADTQPNAWVGYAGSAGFDLRSDTQTGPTASMLAAIQACTLADDVMQEDQTTTDLEAHIAALTGKEAGLFVLSGTMGNQLSLRALLTQPPHAVLCDHRSHIVAYEAGGVSSLTGASLQTVVPSNGMYLTLEDIQEHAHLDDDVHTCPTRVISLENTLGGLVMPLAETRRIAAWARAHGLLLHCDGARLWEVAASGAGSLADYAACFDTVTMCFSKGLGAPVGSVVVGDARTVKHARWVRKALGGGLRQAGVLTAAARVAVDETFGRGPNGEGGLLKKSHETAAEVAALWTGLGGKLLHPVHTNMLWLDLKAAGCPPARVGAIAREHGLKMGGNRIITHYQIYQNREAVLPRLEKVFKAILEEGKNGAAAGDAVAKGPESVYRPK